MQMVDLLSELFPETGLVLKESAVLPGGRTVPLAAAVGALELLVTKLFLMPW